MKIIIGILLSLLVLLAGCGGNITGEAAREGPIKIGFIGPLTGDVGPYGVGWRDGALLALEEINAAGGINGRMLKLISEDGVCRAKESTTAAQKLIGMDKVQAIVGGHCSSETLAAAPIADTAKVVLLSPCSSAPAITEAGDYVFRAYPSDNFQGRYAADYAFEEFGARKAGIFFTNGDWGIGVKDNFKERFIELGGKIIAEESFEQDATDMRAQLTKIMSKKPDFLYMPAYSQGTGLVLKQAKEMGITIPMLGGDAADDPNVIAVAGDSAEGFQFTIVSAVPSEAVDTKYNTKFGHGFVVCGIQSYDVPHIVAEVMSKVGTDATAIKDALYEVDYDGESGRIRFDKNGDLEGAKYAVKEVIDGEFVVVH